MEQAIARAPLDMCDTSLAGKGPQEAGRGDFPPRRSREEQAVTGALV